MEIIIEMAGWVGMFMVVLAYYLDSNKKIDSGSKIYQTLNLLGAIGVGINVFHQQAWPALILQIVWAMIAIISLLKKK